jgi:2Fe-2S ferredoxin
MIPHKNEIEFTIFFCGEKYSIKTYAGEYRNLMQLIADKIFVEDFGDCKGMGRCGTCMVQVSGLKGQACEMERNEKITITKSGIKSAGIRLSCQLLINENLKDATVVIEEGIY